MGADLASENDPYRHQDVTTRHIYTRSPDPAAADNESIENLSKLGSDDPDWLYDQPRKRGPNRRYIGHVERISGVEGERLRENLAVIMRDLLDWARQQTDTASNAESNRKSGEDGGGEGTPS